MNSREQGGGQGQEVQATPSADLTLLVETERRLEELLARAREEARTTVESARAEIQATSAALDLELAAARERFQADVEAERARRAREVLMEGKRQAAEFDAVEQEPVARLGGFVLARLLSGISE